MMLETLTPATALRKPQVRIYRPLLIVVLFPTQECLKKVSNLTLLLHSCSEKPVSPPFRACAVPANDHGQVYLSPGSPSESESFSVVETTSKLPDSGDHRSVHLATQGRY